MATLHAPTTAQRSVSLVETGTIGAIAGAAGGMMMAMVQMVYGGLAGGHTIWDAPMAIWAFVGGSDQFGAPSDHVGSIVLGMGGHLANSMMLGVAFAVLAALVVRTPGAMAPVALGTMFGVAVWIVMRYVVLPLNSGTSDLFTDGSVSPQWIWYVAHAAFGMTLGLGYYALRLVRDARRATA